MAIPAPLQCASRARTAARAGGLAFTPAEWRFILEDPAFLSDEDNSYAAPRRLMGIPVTIVPDHQVAARLSGGPPANRDHDTTLLGAPPGCHGR